MRRSKKWIIIGLLGILPLACLLWMRGQETNFRIDQELELAEKARHAYAISPDFDQIKENLISVHRDYWIEAERRARRANTEVILLSIACFAMVMLALGGRNRRA
jgi:hypothetical protein